MIAPDFIPPFAGIPIAVVLWSLLAFFLIRGAVEIPADHPEAVTGLDVLERTGVHPG